MVPATVNWTGAAAASAALVVASTTRPFLVVVTLNGWAWMTIAYPGPADEPGSVSASRDPSEAKRGPGWALLRALVAGAAAAGLPGAAKAGDAVMTAARPTVIAPHHRLQPVPRPRPVLLPRSLLSRTTVPFRPGTGTIHVRIRRFIDGYGR